MAIGFTRSSVSLDDILSRVTEGDILSFYLGIVEVPCVIQSPLREDKRPSFGLYSTDGKRVFYIDLSTKDSGGLFDLLGQLWGKSYKEVLEHIYNDLINIEKDSNSTINTSSCTIKNSTTYNKETDLQCKVREWRNYDIEYWKSYGIEVEWLKYADVYPISYKIIIKQGQRYTFKADKYAYAYIERKENKVTLKIYQPYNTSGYKWSNKHDNSVISLWTKIPESGSKVCICSSLKDALCLWSNTGIPSLAIQGEGYKISNTAINELKRRFNKIYILLDNDEAGLSDAEKLAEQTGFINIVLPKINGAKDISDLYHSLHDKIKFIQIIKDLF